MNDIAQYDQETGEIMATSVASMNTQDIPLAVRLAKVELDQAISTAKAYPRSMSQVRDRISELVMLDEETAAECIYALPRGGKPIKGPSVRFAEIVVSMFGNCKVGSRVVDVNKFEKYVEAEGVFIDLESGMQRTARIRRSIKQKNGQVYNDDMIVVAGNAACSIALREAILKGVPKALWRKAYDDADKVITGDIKTLAERREGAIRAFAAWGIVPEQIFAALEIGGIDDIGLEQIGTLTAMFKAIKAGNQQVEDYFPAKADKAAGISAAKGTAGKLADLAKGDAVKAQNGDPATMSSGEAGTTRPNAARGRTSAEAAAGEGQGKSIHADKSQEKPAEADAAPAATQGKAEGETPAEQASPAAESDTADTGGTGEISDEAIEAAYQRGRKAHARGMKSDAVPRELTAQPMRDAWVNGWHDAAEEKAGAQ